MILVLVNSNSHASAGIRQYKTLICHNLIKIYNIIFISIVSKRDNFMSIDSSGDLPEICNIGKCYTVL